MLKLVILESEIMPMFANIIQPVAQHQNLCHRAKY